MFDSIKQYLERLTGIKNKSTIKNTGGSMQNFQQTPEPIIDQIEPVKELYKGDELKNDLCNMICDCYPDIKKLSINIVPTKTYIGNGKYDDKYYLNVTWENGVSECRINSIVSCTLADYFDTAHGKVSKSAIRPQLIRMFTEEVILQVSQKYANCIAQNLPINMHNIHCFKVGGVPIYDLAIGELRLMDEII
jgi:hypothetical protein